MASYPVRKEFKKYKFLKTPTNSIIIRASNFLMPYIQRGDGRYKDELRCETFDLPSCKAVRIFPVSGKRREYVLFLHGGGFMMRAASGHKSLAREFAKKLDAEVIIPDYRLSPKYKYPSQVNDALDSYDWILSRARDEKIFIFGDSAGGCLALSLVLALHERNQRLPDGLVLVYPVTDSRMQTESMAKYTDTSLWNSRLNKLMWERYLKEEDKDNPIATPALYPNYSFFPPTYIETAEFDCLRDEGIEAARRIKNDGAPVTLNETKGTIHGYDVALKSEYVKALAEKRIAFMKALL